MYTAFHERYLAKVFAMDMLSKFAGFTNSDKALIVTGSQLEKDPGFRRGVVLSLIKGGFIKSVGMGGDYNINQKAFDECDCENYVGELNIGTHAKPLATWLSGPVMKSAIEDLLQNKAVVQDSATGRGKVVVSTIDGRSSTEVAFDRYLSLNLGLIACSTTEMSTAVSECLKVPINSVTSDGIEAQLAELLTTNQKEVQRLKRTNDALRILFLEVSEQGGWDVFVNGAKTMYSSAE